MKQQTNTKRHNCLTKHKDHSAHGSCTVVGTLLLSTLLSSSILAPSLVNAEGETSVVDDVTITIPTACSLSSTISTGNEHTATITPGSYEDNIGTTDLKALCNDFNGFSIYAIGYSNNAQGTPTMGNNTMIGTNTSSTIATGTQTSGNTSNWAMKLTKVENPAQGDPITYNPDILSITNGFNAYHSVPSTLTQVVQYKDNSTTNSSATDQTLGAHIETTYATYVAGTQPADTYNGKVKYLLVHPANFTTGTYTISYDANHGTGSMNQETNIPNYEPHTIPTSTITPPEGYVLAGWCTESDTTATAQNPQTTCEGASYTDKGTIPASTVPANSSITLYAYYKEPLVMQKISTWGSTLTNVGDEVTAVDSRDGKAYTVAKLADGNIWMTQNLDLAGGTEITSELSNVPDNYTLPTANGFEEGNKLPASSTSGFNDKTKAFVYNSTKTSGTDCTKPGCYSYYSWTAATAGSGLSIDKDNTDAPYSICPKGWKLPNARSTVAGNSDFYQLAVAYGMNSSVTYESTANFYNQAGPDTTPNFLLTGYYYRSSFYLGGSGGYYWSSTSSTSGSSTGAQNLYLNSSLVNSATFNIRWFGYAVRCIAE